MQARAAAGGRDERRRAAFEVVGDRPGPQSQMRAVSLAVQCDLVAGRRDLRGEGGAALDLLSDEKERRARASGVERLEHGRGAFGVGAVVEGERDRSRAGDRGAQAERATRRRGDRRGGGQRVRRRSERRPGSQGAAEATAGQGLPGPAAPRAASVPT